MIVIQMMPVTDFAVACLVSIQSRKKDHQFWLG